MYVRYVEHDDRNGQVIGLKFVGPFANRYEAVNWILAKGGKPFDTYGPITTSGTTQWANNPDEPLEVYSIHDEIPIEEPWKEGKPEVTVTFVEPNITPSPYDDFFFTTEEEAQQALTAANEAWKKENQEGNAEDQEPPEGGRVFRCTRDDSYEGISVLGEGDDWCVIDESGEYMVCKAGEWIGVA